MNRLNNPIGYVRSNMNSLSRYLDDLFLMLRTYEATDALIESCNPQVSREIVALKERVDLDFMRKDLLELMLESLEGIVRVEKIVKDLKDFSRVGESEWQIVDIQAGLESTLNVAANDLKYKADLVRDYQPTPAIECLPFQLNQVFLNLLINAAHAITGRGVITVTTRSDDSELTVSIADTGQGIEAAVINRIFDPFFTTKPIGQGTGLGLSVSYGIVQRHGGRIEVTSEVGVGTTFTVHLPLRQALNCPGFRGD